MFNFFRFKKMTMMDSKVQILHLLKGKDISRSVFIVEKGKDILIFSKIEIVPIQYYLFTYQILNIF